jgi:hypothetical protein
VIIDCGKEYGRSSVKVQGVRHSAWGSVVWASARRGTWGWGGQTRGLTERQCVSDRAHRHHAIGARAGRRLIV